MKKKILYVITKSNFGGAQRYVYDLATNLPREQFDVAVAFGKSPSERDGRLAKLLREKGIHTILVPELARDLSLVADWKSFSTLMGTLKAEKPDVVHLNSSKAAGLGALAARLAGVPRIVFTIHGLPSDEKRPFIQRWTIAILTWLTMMLAHRVITISNDSFTRVRTLPFLYGKTVLVYNGIETPDFQTPHEALESLRAIDPTIPETNLRIGCIGELHANKDLKTAIDALTHREGAHLILAGDGEERAALQQHATERGVRDRVHFLGFIPDAARYLRAFDIILSTSLKEGLPYVLLEAGAAHVPIVAVDIPGARDVVFHEFTGLLAPRDAAVIATAISRIEKDHALRESLTNELGERVLKTFSLPHMVEKTIAQY